MVPQERLAGEARAWAERLARGPAFGLAVTKKLVAARGDAMDLESATGRRGEIQAACMLDPNFREAYEAFRAKREARFE